jgi:hypothetical protein
MAAIVLIAGGAGFFATAWQLLLAAEARATGYLNFLVGLFGTLVALGGLATKELSVPVSLYLLLFSTYFLFEGGMGLFSIGHRSHGFYTLFAGILLGIIGLMLLADAVGAATVPGGAIKLTEIVLGTVGIGFLVPAILRFWHLAVDRPGLRPWVGWVYLIATWVLLVVPGVIILANVIYRFA